MDWREEYRDKGYIIVDNLLPHSLIDAHLFDVSALLRRHGITNAADYARLSIARDDELMAAMLKLHQRSETARRLVADRVARAILRRLFAAEPVVTMARSALWAPVAMSAHVDTAFRSPDPPYSVCRMWCALEDIHPDSGRLYLVPGTHRTITPHLCREVLDERPQLQALFARIADEPDAWYRLLARGWPYVSAKVPDHIDPKAKVSFDLRKGDVVFFNPAVAHGTLACSNPTLTRKMMVCEWAVAEPETEVCEPLAPRHRAEIDGARRGNLVDLVSIRAARASAR